MYLYMYISYVHAQSHYQLGLGTWSCSSLPMGFGGSCHHPLAFTELLPLTGSGSQTSWSPCLQYKFSPLFGTQRADSPHTVQVRLLAQAPVMLLGKTFSHGSKYS